MLVLPYIDMNPPQVYMSSSPEPPPTTLPISSLWVIPVHQPQASCIEPRLAIRFLHDSIHVSMPFSQISADGDCSHEIKRRLLLGRKVMTNLDNIFKSRDITLPTKVRLVKAMVFPVVMYGFESWTVKKAERQRIDTSELWCWRRLLRVPWTARRSSQSILKEIGPGCSLEGLMLKLKRQYFGHLMRRVDSLEKDPDAGRD